MHTCLCEPAIFTGADQESLVTNKVTWYHSSPVIWISENRYLGQELCFHSVAGLGSRDLKTKYQIHLMVRCVGSGSEYQVRHIQGQLQQVMLLL
jgi:hypothetical protein